MSAPVSTFDDTPPGTTHLIARPPMDAAAVLVEELHPRVAELDLVDARAVDVPGDREEPRARALRRADLFEGRGAVRDDPGDVRQRLDVVDDGRALVEPLHGQPRRAVARVALLAFEGREEAGGLAGDVRAGAAIDDDVAGEVRCRGCARRNSPPRRPPRPRPRAGGRAGRTRRGCRRSSCGRRARSSRSASTRPACAGCSRGSSGP